MGRNHEKLRNNLEKHRKASGYTQQDLSLAADVSRKSINAIENGIYIPSTVLALKIAKTLNCTVEDLFELPNIKTNKPEFADQRASALSSKIRTPTIKTSSAVNCLMLFEDRFLKL